MKFKIPVFILFICSLFLCGCHKEDTTTQAKFYYRNNQVNYKDNGTIGSESYAGTLDPLAYNELINAYLSGPNSQDLSNPFPTGTTLVALTIEQDKASVTLTSNFADITGIDLTIACACLSLTVKEITGCGTAEISAQDALLDNQQSIIIDTNAIQLTDHLHP